MKIIKTLVFALAFSAMGIGVSYAQLHCGPRDSVVNTLTGKYGETSKNMGLADGALFEWFGHEGEGTWAILKTTPDGLACVMAAGDNYIHLDNEDAPIDGEPIKFTP